MPFLDPEEAVNAVLRFTPEMPSWPQLPGLGFKHNMIAQFAHDLPGASLNEETKNVFIDLSAVSSEGLEAYYGRLLAGDAASFSLDEGHFPGLFQLARHPDQLRNAHALKGQMSGPVTMGMQILSQQKTPVLFEQTEMELLLKTLKLKARWQSSFLERLNLNPVIIVDEPGMTLMGSPCVPLQKEVAISLLEEVLGDIGGLKGVHCCGNTDWSVLLDASIDLLSFDAYSWAHTLALYSSQIESFLSRGGVLAWGITPTIDESIEKESVDSLMTRLQMGMRQLVEKGIGLDSILDSSIITPACGLGLVTPANAIKALSMTREISTRLRRNRDLMR